VLTPAGRGDLALASASLALAAPLLGSIVSVISRRRSSPARRQWSTDAALVGALAALVSTGIVLAGSPTSQVATLPGGFHFGLVLSPFTVVIATLVTGIGAIVERFSVRYLRGDPTAGSFQAAACLVVVGMAQVALAAGLVQLLASWLLASFAFRRAASLRRDLPGIDRATKRLGRAMVTADAALVVAVVMVHVVRGHVSLTATQASVEGHLGILGVGAGAAVLAAALARSGTWPTSRWLSDAVAVPTPVSALLHAGVANGGALLLLRLGPLVLDHRPLAEVAVALGTVGAVVGGALSRSRGDLKGQLAWSTSSQMSFVLVECGLGLWPLAVVHLVTHACYKADRFLRSSTLPPARLAPAATVGPGRLAAGLLAGLATGLAATVAARLDEVRGGDAFAVSVALASLAAGIALARRGSPSDVAKALATLLLVGAAAGSGIGLLASALPPLALGHSTAELSPWLLLVPIVVGTLVTAALAWRPTRRLLLPMAVDLALARAVRPPSRRTGRADELATGSWPRPSALGAGRWSTTTEAAP